MGSIASGGRLGPYLITQPVGAGGMGEVYRARDTRLERDVAVKVLPAEIAQDPDRRARFEREARAVAALTHPNILAIHDVGSHGGIDYLVTELLEGETLRQRLAEGAVPPRKAVEMAIQIANGLAAAHEKGIVHRDLKPENIFVTRDGRIKILDFGLAARSAAAAADANGATVAAGTQAGMVLGTVGYMSPEQVRGTQVDHRTDIFALGTVLFEILTGRRAFQRDTAAETMTAILREDVPELSSAGRQVPPPLDRIVRRCLEKNPDERLQAARDVAITLEAVSGSDASVLIDAPTLAPPRRGAWPRLAWGAAALLVGAGLGYLVAMRSAPAAVSAEPPSFRQLTFRRGAIRNARFAPDGQSVVYSGVWDDEPLRIYPVRLERPRAESAPIADAGLLAVSRTGDMAVATRPHRQNVFIDRGTLAQVPLSGGAPRELLEDVIQADFAADGRMAIVRSERGRSRLEFPIGTLLYETAGWLFSPRISPDGQRVAFEEHPLHDDDRGWPAVVEVATKVKRNLTPEQGSLSGLAWSPGGQDLCFANARTIRCVGLEKPDVRIVLTGSHRFTLYDIDGDGRMLTATYAMNGAQMAGEVGGREVDVSWQDVSFPIDLSADGKRLVFGSLDYGVNLRGLDAGPPIRLAEGIPSGISPDGRTVLALAPGVPTTIKIVPIGAGTSQTLPRGSLEGHTWAVWMPDGRQVVISASEPGHSTRLYLQDVVGGAPRAFTGEGVRLMTYLPRVVSPDGRFVMAVGPDQQPVLYSVADGESQPIAGLGTDLSPIAWGETSNVIFARGREAARLVPVFKIDLSTGRRDPVVVVGPVDSKGAPRIMIVQVARDGRRYAYNTTQFVGALYLVEGVKP